MKIRVNELIEKYRVEQNEDLSIKKIAERAGVSRQVLSKWYGGDIDMAHLVILDKLCKFFKVEAGDILVYIPDEEAS
ncbi:MAG: helix-turn-helix domain-containing protein [Aggregatilineales bacterium]